MANKNSIITDFDIIKYRMYNQQIASSKFKKPAELTAWLGAIQAQDYPGAKWSLALRLRNLTDDDIEQAIADRIIVRTWPIRGTLHFVNALDIRWMLKLMAPQIIKANYLRNRTLELDDRTFTRCSAVFEKQMRGGKELTREELTDALLKAGIAADGVRLSHILHHAALNQLVCYGKRRGR